MPDCPFFAEFCGGVKRRLFQSARLGQSCSNGCCCLCIAHVPVPKKRCAKKQKLLFGSGTLVVPQQFISYFRLLPWGDVVGRDEVRPHVGNPVNCTTKQHLYKKSHYVWFQQNEEGPPLTGWQKQGGSSPTMISEWGVTPHLTGWLILEKMFQQHEQQQLGSLHDLSAYGRRQQGNATFFVLTGIVKPVGTKRQCNYFRNNAAACWEGSRW